MKKDFLQALQLDENHERECKLAEKSLPERRRIHERKQRK